MTDELEFRRMVLVSAGFHVTLIAAVLTASAVQKARLFNPPDFSGGPLNVMWAEVVQSPPETRSNKLPGPVVQAEPAVVPKTEQPKVVMPESLSKELRKAVEEAARLDRTKSEEEGRKKAMADAVASLKTRDEKRPTPRPDNFPSLPGAKGARIGLPAGPFGGAGGIAAGNPEFAAYRMQIRQILKDNLIWLQRRPPPAVVTFRIDAAGNVLDPQVAKSSGNTAFDNATIRAVKKSSPLPLPPPQLAQQIIGEDFAVDFNLDVQ